MLNSQVSEVVGAITLVPGGVIHDYRCLLVNTLVVVAANIVSEPTLN